MSRHGFTSKQALAVAMRVVLVSVTLGYAMQGEGGGQSFIEDASSQGGGIGFVILMSLQRA